ncbi:MAG: hypothetical protein HXX13_17665 [Bacteroidetes bacterium]|nr:hypothetical protein [Bacteroidota bacterium]
MKNIKFRKTINPILYTMAILTLSACGSSGKLIKKKIAEEFTAQPLQSEEILTREDITHLPVPVQKYLIYTGAVGKVKPQNARIEFDAEMFQKPGASAMKAHSCQYNFFGNYTRIFFMKAGKMGIPFRARHIYSNQQATFIVRVAGLFNVVNIKGEDLTRAETVTVLNDMCVFVPGSFTDKRLSWKEIDSLTAEVTLTNGPYKVSARLLFNEKGELINFISDDRSAIQDDGTLKTYRWSTPVKDYIELDGRRIPSYGETIWHYPDGDFTYGRFSLKSIKYNVSQ